MCGRNQEKIDASNVSHDGFDDYHVLQVQLKRGETVERYGGGFQGGGAG